MSTVESLRTLKRRLESEAARHGATLRWTDDGRFGAEAPAGHIWAEGMAVHELMAYPDDDPDAYVDMLQRISYGVEPCTYGPDCEWCTDESGGLRRKEARP